MLDRTERGFAIFARIPTRNGGTLRVQESSLAYQGAHIWLFLDGEECVDHLGQHVKPDPHLSVAQAKALLDALDAFIAAAESGDLTESVSVD